MNVKIIASGSAGNCALIEGVITIDIGVKPTPDVMRSEVLLLTHEHTDHTKMLSSLAGIPFYTVEDVAERLKAKHPYVTFNILPYDKFTELPLATTRKYYVKPVRLKHDVPCVGWDIISGMDRILFATDFNEIIDNVDLIDYDALYLECNNTLSICDFSDVYFGDSTPRDEFHRRKSFQNHCNVQYLIDKIKEDKAGNVPLTLLHKSSYYYDWNKEKLSELANVANITNLFN